MEKKLLKKPVSPYFQLILIIINLFFITIFSYFFHKNFYSLDYFPKTNILNISNSEESTVPLNLKIKEIVDSDVRLGKVTFDLNLSFILKENLNEEELNKKINFLNGKILKLLLEKKEVNNNYYYSFNYVVELKNKLNYSMYPFDDHVASLKLKINRNFFKKELVSFFPKVKINDENDFSGWKLHDSKIKSSYSKDKNFQKINFFFALNKEGYKITLSILFPLFILFMLNLLSMSLNLIEGRKIIITSLLGLNSFRIVLENSSPKTTYLLTIDVFYLLFLIISLIIFFLHLLEIEMKKKLSYLIISISHLSIIIIFLYYLSPWIF